MYLSCKFIPSSRLTVNELPNILTPDECANLLSRLRSANDILGQLPKPLAQTLSISAQKTPTALLAAIQAELGKGNWVALSLSGRRTPLSEAQLQRFPRLRALIYSVSLSRPVHMTRGSYTPIQDDVVLAPPPPAAAAEPTPEYKIVVEFAGQGIKNAASLALGKTQVQGKKIAILKPDPNHKHRSLATFNDLQPESKTLYIQIPCTDQPQPILLRLAEGIQPVDKEAEKEEWDNVLVPVRLLAYLDDNNDKAKAADLKDAYLYLFWKGKLWREMLINERGFYQDIDVEYYRIREREEKQKQASEIIVREANGFPMAHFWAPYRILGQVQQGSDGLKVIFSPTQKRFSQIEALEDDPSLLDKSSISLDELSGYSDAQSFSVQTHTSDVDSATIHKVTEDDMPWLSDKQAIVRSYDQSNTVIAYVDGQNNGLRVRLEVTVLNGSLKEQLDEAEFASFDGLVAIMEDSESDWRVTQPFDLHSEDGYITALITGLPPKGRFTLVFGHLAAEDSAVMMFKDWTYEQIIAERPVLPTPAKREEYILPPEVDEEREFQRKTLDMLLGIIFDE